MPVENKPVSFGYKMAWLVLRTDDTDRVIEALGLTNLTPANWTSGLESAYIAGDIFVSPPVRGCVFAVGKDLFGAGNETNKSMEPFKEFLRELSTQFDEVQAFASHRIVEYHHWVLARSGSISRSFAYSGEMGEVWDDEGSKTLSEPRLHLNPDDDEFNVPDEQWVMEIAGAWSINPQNLDDEPHSSRLGMVGSSETIPCARERPRKKKGFRLPWFR